MNRNVLAIILMFPVLSLMAQDPPAAPPAAQAPVAAPGGRGGGPSTAEPQPYEKVVTKEAKSKTGVFTVHQIKYKYYYEIPKKELGREFLWNTQIAKTTLGAGYGGQELIEHVVTWQLTGNKVHLREVKYDVAADPKTPIALAVDASNNHTIVMTFPVAAFAKDGAPVIEVTRLFSTDVPEFSARQRLGATTMDATRSSIDRISPYPENIETITRGYVYTRGHAGRRQCGGPPSYRRRPDAPGQCDHCSPPQHGEAAGAADGAPHIRSARRIFFSEPDGLQQRRAPRGAGSLYHPVEAGEERPQRRALGTGKADRLLY